MKGSGSTPRHNSSTPGLPEVVIFEPTFEDLHLSCFVVERGLGYRNARSPNEVSATVNDLLALAPAYSDLRCGFVILPERQITLLHDTIVYDSKRLQIGGTIAASLRGTVSLAVLVATAGPRLERWATSLTRAGDLIGGLVVDAVGSLAAEKTMVWLEQKVAVVARRRGWKVTSRYGPGYCGWQTSDQQMLFSLLPPGFCGVALTGSSLMVPVKSISGVIGLGQDVHREGYRCETCDFEDCFRREVDPSESFVVSKNQ